MRLPVAADRIQLQPARLFPPGSLILIEGAGVRAPAVRCTWKPHPDDPEMAMALMLHELSDSVQAGSLIEVRNLVEDVLGIPDLMKAEVDALSQTDGEVHLHRDGPFAQLGIGRAGAFVSAHYHPDRMRTTFLWVSPSDWTARALGHADKPEVAFSRWRLRLPGGTESEPLMIDMPPAVSLAFE